MKHRKNSAFRHGWSTAAKLNEPDYLLYRQDGWLTRYALANGHIELWTEDPDLGINGAHVLLQQVAPGNSVFQVKAVPSKEMRAKGVKPHEGYWGSVTLARADYRMQVEKLRAHVKQPWEKAS